MALASFRCREKFPVYTENNNQLIGFEYGRAYRKWRFKRWEIIRWYDPPSCPRIFVPLEED